MRFPSRRPPVSTLQALCMCDISQLRRAPYTKRVPPAPKTAPRGDHSGRHERTAPGHWAQIADVARGEGREGGEEKSCSVPYGPPNDFPCLPTSPPGQASSKRCRSSPPLAAVHVAGWAFGWAHT